jgi:galactokinase
LTRPADLADRVPEVSEDIPTAIAAAFRERTGRAPVGIWVAPGRVNLIGEHTDYNDGFVMPFALAQSVTIAAAQRTDANWTVASTNTGTTEAFGQADLVPGLDGWQAYVAGVVWALQQAGHEVAGADLVLSSTVPIGAGLSSSAALECATLTTLAELNNLQIEPLERAKLARRCENEFVGAPTGLMDQAASTLCRPDHALFFDCRTFDFEQVPLGLNAASLEILVLDTKTPHALVDSEYADRRATCEEAAALLGVTALRDVDDLDAALAQLPDPVMQRRLRHVVTENARVVRAAQTLRAGDVPGLGPLLNASHASMRDDFEITVGTVDLAVEAAREAGAIGARMTGGGFGGCIIALVGAGEADRVAAHIGRRFARAGFDQPAHFLGVPSRGATRIG